MHSSRVRVRNGTTSFAKLMLLRLCLGMLALLLTTLSPAIAEDTRVATNWEEVMAKGIVPYRQLTVADFPVNDSAHPGSGFFIRARFQPYYTYYIKPHTTGWIYAYVDQWKIFSGLDKNETSRKSKVTNMKAELPFAQAILDINEILFAPDCRLEAG